MTKYEKLKSMDIDKMAKFLSKSLIACEICPDNNNICDCNCEKNHKELVKLRE